MRRPDPVCAAVAESYFDAYIVNVDACAKATEAYIAEFDGDSERAGRGTDLAAESRREPEIIWFSEV